jgi:ABC-type antimicrobial peptide transport system permease subunit
LSILIRQRGRSSLAPALSTAVHDTDSRLFLSRTDSLASVIALGLTSQRVFAAVGGVMGLVALLLAVLGLYGMTAYAVTLRRKEFAIRLALGASRARVVRMVLSQGLLLLFVGLLLGLAFALGMSQVLSAFFYGLPAAHPPTLLFTTILFVTVGTAASFIPSTQAVGNDWLKALHQD